MFTWAMGSQALKFFVCAVERSFGGDDVVVERDVAGLAVIHIGAIPVTPIRNDGQVLCAADEVGIVLGAGAAAVCIF